MLAAPQFRLSGSPMANSVVVPESTSLGWISHRNHKKGALWEHKFERFEDLGIPTFNFGADR